MDERLLIIRLTELRDQLAENSKKLHDLDNLLADGVTDEAVKKFAEELAILIEDKETITREARSLLLQVNGGSPSINGETWVN